MWSQICLICIIAASGAGQDSDGVDQVFLSGLARIEEDLAGSQNDCSVCLICLEDLHPDDAVWTCRDGCYCLFHLVCIQVTMLHPVLVGLSPHHLGTWSVFSKYQWHALKPYDRQRTGGIYKLAHEFRDEHLTAYLFTYLFLYDVAWGTGTFCTYPNQQNWAAEHLHVTSSIGT